MPELGKSTVDKEGLQAVERDGRFVRLHTNFPHHRDGMLKLLGAEYTRLSEAMIARLK